MGCPPHQLQFKPAHTAAAARHVNGRYCCTVLLQHVGFLRYQPNPEILLTLLPTACHSTRHLQRLCRRDAPRSCQQQLHSVQAAEAAATAADIAARCRPQLAWSAAVIFLLLPFLEHYVKPPAILWKLLFVASKWATLIHIAAVSLCSADAFNTKSSSCLQSHPSPPLSFTAAAEHT